MIRRALTAWRAREIAYLRGEVADAVARTHAAEQRAHEYADLAHDRAVTIQQLRGDLDRARQETLGARMDADVTLGRLDQVIRERDEALTAGDRLRHSLVSCAERNSQHRAVLTDLRAQLAAANARADRAHPDPTTAPALGGAA